MVPQPYPFSFSRHLGLTMEQGTACPLAKRSRLAVEISRGAKASVTATSPVRVEPAGKTVTRSIGDEAVEYAVYDVQDQLKDGAFDPTLFLQGDVHHAVARLTATRFITSTGREWDSIVTELYNDDNGTMEVTVIQTIPWFLNVYTHTLSMHADCWSSQGADSCGDETVAQPETIKSKFLPSVARVSPHLWELTLRLPPKTHTTLKFDFERGYLRYSEYPADPYRGFEVPAGIVFGCLIAPHANSEAQNWADVIDEGGAGKRNDFAKTVRIYTEAINVQMPSPDFSMPYNVISISSTILAISFGIFLKAGIYQTIPIQPDQPPAPNFLARLKARFSSDGKKSE